MTDESPKAPMLHKSVLLDEVLTYLDPKPGRVYLDVTFGSGGHTRAILQRDPDCMVIAFDWDMVSLDTYGPPMTGRVSGKVTSCLGEFCTSL